MKLQGATMAGLAVAHANVHHIPYGALPIPDVRGENTFPLSKFCWMSGSRYVHYGQSVSARRPFNRMKNHKGLSSNMLILPKASYSVEPQAQHFPEYWQSIIKILENKAFVDVKLLPISTPPQLYSENIVVGLLHNFSAIPNEVSIAAVAAILGSTLGYVVAALPTRRKERRQNKGSVDTEPLAGEWLLVMKSTPFNRFVMMRCPSIMFENEDACEGLSKKLLTEGHHVVTLSNHNASRSDKKGDVNVLGDHNDSDDDGEWAGSVLRNASKNSNSFAEEGTHKGDFTPSYQRSFLHTDDGGVLAVDWPSHLELFGEPALDTTLLLVSGSADGSGDKDVQELAKRSVRCGYFPIVLNPRGCGGSPLTTPRLFTAGDSDDVRTAVLFVLKSRPWATLMAVGWGYGANMLVKYLGEEAEAAPMTAAVCVENIFDLEETNWLRNEDHDSCFDQKMTSGFVQILKSNQMVFQGRKDFDVQKGLLAKSIRDFDEAISMVSKGYDGVQEFYKDSSSKSWINNVKIPVFYIQDIKSIGKTFSIPRHVFEDNPFTTLILQLTRKGKSPFQTMATGFCHSLVIEWLAAVEIAFLKGRHPLLEGLDVTFQPQSKGRSAHQQSQSSAKGGELMVRKMNPLTGIRRGGNSNDYFPSVNQRDRDLSVWNRDKGIELNAPHNESNAPVNTSNTIYRVNKEKLRSEGDSGSMEDSHESSDESGDDESEVEQGQVRQAAESIMKVLDVTMPGTLSEKQKEEVLQAVGRGESIVTALQEACPEDVREKMTTAVSAAVQARGISLKLAGFGKSMPAPKLPDGMVEKIQEKLSSLVPNKLPVAFTHDAAKTSLSDNSTNNSNEVVGSGDQSKISSQNEGPKSLVLEKQPESSTSAMEPVHQAGSEVEEQVFTQGQTPEKEMQNNNSLESNATEQGKGDSIARPASRTNQGDTAQLESKATEQETGDSGARTVSNDSRTNQGDTIQVERQGDPLPHEEQKCDGQDQKQESSGVASQTTELPQTEKKNDSSTDSIISSDKKIPDPNLGEVSPPQIPSQIPAAPPLPSIDMSRAFEALTGVDDSTQMAVTNVFGVIENVLEKLEKEQGQKDVPLEQPSSPEHQNSSTQTSHTESAPGTTYQKQSSVQVEPSGSNSGHQQIPETGNDESKRNLGETSVKTSTNREIEQTLEVKKLRTDHNCPAESSPASTGLKNNSTLDTDQELDDANLALEYFEDENVWKLIDVTMDTRVVSGTQDNSRAEKLDYSHTGNTNLDTLTGMETNPVAVKNNLKSLQIQNSLPARNFNNMHLEFASESSMSNGMGSTRFFLKRKVQEVVIDALELELLRRLGNSNLDTTLQQDIEKIGSAVAETAELSLQFRRPDLSNKRVLEKTSDCIPLQLTGKAEKLHVETIISAINEVYGNMATLPSLLPAGVLFGVVLAALSPLDIISTDDAQDSREPVQIQRRDSGFRSNLSLVQSGEHQKTGFVDSDYSNFHRPGRPFLIEQSHGFTDNGASSEVDSGKEAEDRGLSPKDIELSGGPDACNSEPGEDLSAQKTTPTSNNMMGAVAAAMGATATLASQEPSSENLSNLSEHDQQRTDSQVTPNIAARFGDGGEAVNDDSKPSIVSTLAEKAMSVAAPVVPTKEDGGVDHERLVEILAGLGQKGGILRFVGKMALLWGGLRGAMSLTDRLLVFLHMSDRPLYQRLLGFMVMAFLLWSPVLVPLLPALLQQWASGSRNGVASTAALLGLYGAVVILITIWGRKIRGYEDPLQRYGVSTEPSFNARQLQSLMSGLALGLSLVASVYLLGVSLHILQFDWAPALSFNSSKTFLWNLVSGWRIFKLLVQCFSISLAVSFVEELFFRSWLQEEISADLGFHRATALSGFAFSISHWSLPVMPGLWLLSLVLIGAKVGCNGDLTLAIGIHAGLIAGTQLINIGGQVKYAANASLWFFGHQTGDPFTGLIGVSILGALALLFYPWGYNGKDKP